MSDVMFYQKPVLLSREAHQLKKISSQANFSFARQAQSLYVAGVEFAQACAHYPVVFTQLPDQHFAPVAVLGLREGENLFVDAQGAWQGSYVPAFVRRYPFVLAQLEGQTMGVCIDEAYAGLNEHEGQALFDSQGKNTPFLQNALDFLSNFQEQHIRTAQFSKRLADFGLLKPMNATAQLAGGETFSLDGLWVVDEAKLLQLGDAQALQLYRTGELAWVYAHLVSLSRFNHLVERMAK